MNGKRDNFFMGTLDLEIDLRNLLQMERLFYHSKYGFTTGLLRNHVIVTIKYHAKPFPLSHTQQISMLALPHGTSLVVFLTP